MERKSILTTLVMFFSLISLHTANAAGKLTLYCSMQYDVCERVAKAFGQQYQVDTQFVRHSTGAALAKIKSEQSLPQADVWYGGTIEPHFQAGALGLLHAYRSPRQAEILPVFQELLRQKGEFTSIAYMIVFGLGMNPDQLDRLGISDYPKCMRDLLDPRLKNQVQLPDPRSSGTGYTFLTAAVQLWGEEKAFEYLKALNQNVSQYTKSGVERTLLARGEVAVSIGFLSGYALEKAKGAPVAMQTPCEGTPYSLGGISILHNARNLDNAKLFMDWALSAEAQELALQDEKTYQYPTNVNAKLSPDAVDPAALNLIPFDFDRFGSDAEAKRLIERWTREIKLN
ncbi:ABC transporter substrate-binding protein [Necropsobacter massiliensis]|uniref:ABC transporter substrate-binding protein n=1 Tax=Necropsobacter massiliensis TaxID=1400001 RepID=UPI000595B995|nr:ABC transporter substrate-binding protein [Necropsobacter massiliensis]